MNYRDSNLKFVRAGAGKYLLFLNRTPSTWQEEDEDVRGYHYDEVTVDSNSSSRDELISALIHTRYSTDREIAILRQKDTKEAEFAAYNEFAESCKILIDEMLGVKIEENEDI